MMYMSSVLKIFILFYACSSRFCMHTIDAQRYNNKMNNRSHNKDNNLKEISYSQRPQKIKQEIDILDQEIIELRQQLQSIITKK